MSRDKDIESLLAEVDENPSPAACLKAKEKILALPSASSMPHCRVLVLSNFTVTPIVSCLTVEACRLGIRAEAVTGDFGQIEQVLLNRSHPLLDPAPDVVFVLVDPETTFDAAILSGEEGLPQRCDTWATGLLSALSNWAEAAEIPVVCGTFLAPLRTPSGILEPETQGIAAALAKSNQTLSDLAAALPGLHILDMDRVLSGIGRKRASDPRMQIVARIPFTHEAFAAMSKEMARFLWAIKGMTKKCLVLDLDNTLWGGIVGEDGWQGIALGNEAPGLAFKRFQQALKGLQRTGVILSACSKNNESDVNEAFEKHPEMVLSLDDFSAVRINWRDKAANIRELAEDLNIGLDSMVFVDDDQRERELIHEQLPSVTVHPLPEDPALFVNSLLDAVYFEKLSLTVEDRKRTDMYRAGRKRKEIQKTAGSFEDYLRNLNMRITVRAVDDADFPRVHQLTGKTNQFNLTTIRYTEQELKERISDPESEVYSLRVSDRFGDSGLTGVAVLRHEGKTCRIESFLLSCRVLGRTVETAFLSFLSGAAQARGATRLSGEYRPTPKNAPAKAFYERHGFQKTESSEGMEAWLYDLKENGLIAMPAWFEAETGDAGQR